MPEAYNLTANLNIQRIRLNPSAISAFQKQVGKIQASIPVKFQTSKIEQELTRLKGKIREVERDAKRSFGAAASATNRMTGQTERATKAYQQLGTAAHRANGPIWQGGRIMSTFSRDIYSLTAGVLSLHAGLVKLQQGFQKFREFEDVFTTPMKQLSDAKTTAQLSKTVRGSAGAYGVPREVLGESVITLKQAGFDSGELESTIDLLSKVSLNSQVGTKNLKDFSDVLILLKTNFNQTGKTAEDTTNKMIAATKNYAVDMDLLNQTFKVYGSVAKTYRNDTQDIIALATVASQSTRQSASVISNALKTIQVRLSSGTTQNKLAGIGVNVFDDMGQIKSMPKILNEVGRAIQGVSDAAKFDILEAIAGKRQIATLSGIMNNLGLLNEVMEKIGGNVNELDSDAAKAMDSIGNHVVRMKEKWISLFDAMESPAISSLTKGLIDATGVASNLLPLLATIGAAKGIGMLRAGGMGGKFGSAMPFMAGGAMALGSQYAASKITADTEVKAFSKSLLEGASSASMVAMGFGKLAGVTTGVVHSLFALEKHLTNYRAADIQEKLKGTQDRVSNTLSEFGLTSGETAKTLSLMNEKIVREAQRASVKDTGFDQVMRGFKNLWSGDFRNVGSGARKQLGNERVDVFKRELAPTLESLKTAVSDYASEGGKRQRLEGSPIGLELEKAFKRLTPGENLSFKSFLDSVYQSVQAEKTKTNYAEQQALIEQEKLAAVERQKEYQDYITSSIQRMSSIFEVRARSAQMATQFKQGNIRVMQSAQTAMGRRATTPDMLSDKLARSEVKGMVGHTNTRLMGEQLSQLIQKQRSAPESQRQLLDPMINSLKTGLERLADSSTRTATSLLKLNEATARYQSKLSLAENIYSMDKEGRQDFFSRKKLTTDFFKSGKTSFKGTSIEQQHKILKSLNEFANVKLHGGKTGAELKEQVLRGSMPEGYFKPEDEARQKYLSQMKTILQDSQTAQSALLQTERGQYDYFLNNLNAVNSKFLVEYARIMGMPIKQEELLSGKVPQALKQIPTNSLPQLPVSSPREKIEGPQPLERQPVLGQPQQIPDVVKERSGRFPVPNLGQPVSPSQVVSQPKTPDVVKELSGRFPQPEGAGALFNVLPDRVGKTRIPEPFRPTTPLSSPAQPQMQTGGLGENMAEIRDGFVEFGKHVSSFSTSIQRFGENIKEMPNEIEVVGNYDVKLDFSGVDLVDIINADNKQKATEVCNRIVGQALDDFRRRLVETGPSMA